VRASAARLGRHADATNFRMRLAPAEVSRRLAEGLVDAVDVDDYVVYPRRNGWRYRGVEMDTAIVDAEGLCPLYGSSEHMCGNQPLVWGVPTKLQNSLARSHRSRFG
jgi:hypothetical protein